MFRLQKNGTGILRSNGTFSADAPVEGNVKINSNDIKDSNTIEQKPKKTHKGISANKLVIPIICVIVILHAMIIYFFLEINVTSTKLSTTMQQSGTYINGVSSLMSGTGLLSETSSNYILMPVTSSGEPNFGVLTAYAAEFENDRRGDDVVARFEEYEVSDEVMALLEEAAESSNAMIEAQLHAIALVSSVYPLPPIPALSALPLPELTEEEMAMTDEEKLQYAGSLILSEEYAQNRRTVSTNVSTCLGIIQEASTATSVKTSREMMILRQMMWIATFAVIVVLIIVFVILYRQIVWPLRRFVRLIGQDSSLDEEKGLQEVRLVAGAYNDLMQRRDALDTILRSAAVTDTLTDLPNRYGYEQYLLESGKSGYSLAIFLFDVNYLKDTNDQYGHTAGDQLLKKAADCIDTCFGNGTDSRCFRIGGDEFAAVVKNCEPVQLGKMIEQFEKIQENEGISISWGYDYTDDIGKTTVKTLFDQADANMYNHKKKIHQDHENHR